MAGLTADRDTPMLNGNLLYSFDHGAAVTIYRGALLALDSTGAVVPATTATGLIMAGRANTGTADDRARVDVRRGVMRLDNSAGGAAVTKAAWGAQVFAVDDHTVAVNNGGGTRSVAGICRGVDAQGVWVEV